MEPALKREIDSAIMHGAFFVDSGGFHDQLRQMPAEEQARYQTKAISFTNKIYEDEHNKRRARVKACFVNNAMLATLRCAVIPDALEDGAVVSGVGGQYNFIAQAFSLRDARSNATRWSHGKACIQYCMVYSHETIPWHCGIL